MATVGIKGLRLCCRYNKLSIDNNHTHYAIFGRVGRLATEEVVLQGEMFACSVIRIRVCSVNVSDMRSLEFILKSLNMIKLFLYLR